jgi:hypothetical protein
MPYRSAYEILRDTCASASIPDDPPDDLQQFPVARCSQCGDAAPPGWDIPINSRRWRPGFELWRRLIVDNNQVVCPNCAMWWYRCPDCDRACRYLSDMSITTHGYSVCADCITTNFRECDECGGYVRDGVQCDTCFPYEGDDDDDYYRDSDDDYYDDDDDCHCDGDETCDHCHGSRCYIRNWDYRPYPFRFHHNDDETDPWYLGIELEVETGYHNRSHCASIAAEGLGKLGYLKDDGSLDYGFEIVTHPMTYAWAKDNFPWDLLTKLDNEGARNDDNAGLHVHVSRTAFSSPAHTYKWIKLFYRNQRGVRKIARRNSGSYAAFDHYDRRMAKEYAKGDRRSGNRYVAINVQNTDTFEVRVFASTLDPTHLRAVIDFIAASVEYTRTLTVTSIVQYDGWGWESFTKWVSARPEYAALAAEMSR